MWNVLAGFYMGRAFGSLLAIPIMLILIIYFFWWFVAAAVLIMAVSFAYGWTKARLFGPNRRQLSSRRGGVID